MEDGRDDYGWEEGQLVVGTAVKQLKCTQWRTEITHGYGQTNIR